MEEIIYIPDEKEKAIITSVCDQVIDFMEPLSIPQKAFALNQLLYSFEDVSGIKATAIIDKEAFRSSEE